MKKNFKRFMVSASAAILSVTVSAETLSSFAYSQKGEEVVSFAESKEGVISGRPNEVTDFYGVVGEWCAMFVQYCASMVGVGDKVPYSSYCDDQYGFSGGVQYFKNKGQYYDRTYSPKRSDIIYIDWDGDKKADHVGFVSGNDGYTVYTVEGNRDDAVGSGAYSLDSKLILGYGVPDYDGSGYITDVSGIFDSSGCADCTVVSSVGAWLRSSSGYGDNKIGIVSTGTQLHSDGYFGEWLHFTDVPVEGTSARYSGWINASTLSATAYSQTPVYEPETPQYTPEYVPDYQYGETKYINSSVGAWLRSSASFSEQNKIGILDTAQAVDVYGSEGEWLSVGTYLNGSYTYGYIHNSTLTKGESNKNRHVVSPIGCNFRSDPECREGNIIGVLDYNDPVEVLSITGDWAFVKSDLYGTSLYGYVHSTTISE